MVIATIQERLKRREEPSWEHTIEHMVKELNDEKKPSRVAHLLHDIVERAEQANIPWNNLNVPEESVDTAIANLLYFAEHPEEGLSDISIYVKLLRSSHRREGTLFAGEIAEYAGRLETAFEYYEKVAKKNVEESGRWNISYFVNVLRLAKKCGYKEKYEFWADKAVHNRLRSGIGTEELMQTFRDNGLEDIARSINWDSWSCAPLG